MPGSWKPSTKNLDRTPKFSMLTKNGRRMVTRAERQGLVLERARLKAAQRRRSGERQWASQRARHRRIREAVAHYQVRYRKARRADPAWFLPKIRAAALNPGVHAGPNLLASMDLHELSEWITWSIVRYVPVEICRRITRSLDNAAARHPEFWGRRHFTRQLAPLIVQLSLCPAK